MCNAARRWARSAAFFRIEERSNAKRETRYREIKRKLVYRLWYRFADRLGERKRSPMARIPTLVPNEKLVPAPSLGRGLRYTRANWTRGKESEGGHRPGKISRVANPSERPRSDVRSAWNVINHGGIRYRVSPVPPWGEYLSPKARTPYVWDVHTRAGSAPANSWWHRPPC